MPGSATSRATTSASRRRADQRVRCSPCSLAPRSSRTSSSREPMPSFGKTLRRWWSIVRGERKRRAPISRVGQALGDELADRELLRRQTVRVDGGRRRARSPVARSSRSARAAHGSAPTRSKISSARRRGARASTRRGAGAASRRNASSVRARSKGRASPCSAIARRKWRSPRAVVGHPAGALEQALDPGQPDCGRELLELRPGAASASPGRSRCIATSQASLARLAASAGCATRAERLLGRLVAAQPDLVQRRCVRGDRARPARGRGSPASARRLAAGGREARRVAAHGGGARDVGEASREDRRLARLARQPRALVGCRRGACEATRVVVGRRAQARARAAGSRSSCARARRAPPGEQPRRQPLVAEQPRGGDAVRHQLRGRRPAVRSSTISRSSPAPAASPAGERPEPHDGAPDDAGSRRRPARRSCPRARPPPPARRSLPRAHRRSPPRRRAGRRSSDRSRRSRARRPSAAGARRRASRCGA